MTEHFMDDQSVKKHYDTWIKGATLLDHLLDRQRFYRFVKACVAYAGHQNVRGKLDTSILRLHLYDDLHGTRSEEAYDETSRPIIALFEDLLEYEDTAFP